VTTSPLRQPLAFTSADEVVAALREAGHRVSRAVRLVLDALFAAAGPVSAEQIADGLDGRLARLELTSVYRNLERLERLGVVSHAHIGHGPGLYALARGGDPEYLVCDRCGAVRTVDHAALQPVRDAVRDTFGHVASFSHFPIHGLCPDCVRAGPSPRHEHRHGELTHTHPHGDAQHDHA
jgi:Fur family ferric uptake transcriptional regulator